MTATELDELERLAKAATPGPWRDDGIANDVCDECGTEINDNDGIIRDPSGGGICAVLIGSRSAADLAFIASANPQTVLALIAEVRWLQAQLLVEIGVNADYPDMVYERDALSAENERLRNREHTIAAALVNQGARLAAERDSASAKAEEQRHLADLGWAEVDKLRAKAKQ